MPKAKDERKRVDVFFNPEKDRDLIEYLESSKVPNATLVKDLMRAGLEAQNGVDINYGKLESVIRKVIREEGVKAVEQPKAEAIKIGPFGAMGKRL